MARRRIVLRDYTQVREGDTIVLRDRTQVLEGDAICKYPRGRIEVERDDPPEITVAPGPGNRVALIIALASALAFTAGALIF